jgi:ribosome recycling factor
MVKFVGQIAEQGRIGIRQVREEVIKLLKKAETDGGVGKDELAAAQKKLQAMIDDYNATIKQIVADKEKEIMTV